MLNEKSFSKIEIRPLTSADVSYVASLHRQIFVDYFLTHLDQRFLELYYSEFVGRPENKANYGFVACVEKEIVGTVIGTSNAHELYKGFYRRNTILLCLIVLKQFVLDSFVRTHLLSRMSHIKLALKSIIPFANVKLTMTNVTVSSTSLPTARLLSICVDSHYRGKYGVANNLVRTFCTHLSKEGIEYVGLSVRKDNLRAISFYKKNGWAQEKADGDSISFIRPTVS